MNVAAKRYEFVAEIAPQSEDTLVPKKLPSAFFGTPLEKGPLLVGICSLWFAASRSL